MADAVQGVRDRLRKWFSARPETPRLSEERDCLAVDLALRSTEEILARTARNIAEGSGLAMSGNRVAVFVTGKELHRQWPALGSAVRRRIPLVVHATLDERTHRDFHAVAASGAVLFFARGGQQAIDLTLAARCIAELALTPVVVAVDAVTAADERDLALPAADAVRELTGLPEDEIDCPTPAQTLLFGETRRRLPVWFDLDRPVAVGATLDSDDAVAAAAGGPLFFDAATATIAEEVLATVAERTGRPLGVLRRHRMEGARYVLLAEGSAVAVAEAVADRMHAGREKVGVLGVTSLRPFPAGLLREELDKVEAVTVIERNEPSPGSDPPLLCEVRAALAAAPPRLLSATCSSVSETEVSALVANMQAGGEARPVVRLGVAAPERSDGFPKQDVLHRRLIRDFPEIERLALPSARATSAVGEAAAEEELPAVVRRFTGDESTYDSVPRIWGELVQPRLHRNEGVTVPDPYRTLGAVPACTATFDDRSPERLSVPAVDPDRCTGCGRCWTACPDSAVAPLSVATATLLDAAADRAARDSRQAPDPAAGKLRRAHKQLAGRFDKLSADGSERRLSNERMREAFDWLAGKMKLEDEDRSAVERAFEATAGGVRELPLSLTDLFFHEPHANSKGSGEMLMLAIDPRACTGCGVCAAVCGDDAIRMEEQDEQRLASMRSLWREWERLPDTSGATIARLAMDPRLGALPAILLSRHTLHSVTGGGDSEPGSGERLAVRLVVASVEYRMQRRVLERVDSLDDLGGRLRDKIRGGLAGAVPVEDLEQFERVLAGVRRQHAGAGEILSSLEARGEGSAVDVERIRNLVRAARDVERERWLAAEGGRGVGRARFGVVVAGDEVARWARTFPHNPFSVPVAFASGVDGCETALGLVSGLVEEYVEGIRHVRRAELFLEGPADLKPRLQEIDESGWEGLSAEQRALCPPLIVIGDTDLLADLEGWTRLLSSGAPVKIVLLDGHDLLVPRVDPVRLALAHGGAFAMSASIAHPAQLLEGVSAALDFGGPAIIHLHAPSPKNHGFDAAQTVERARLAVDCRVHPLVMFDPSGRNRKPDIHGNPSVDRSWLGDEESGALTPAHWAAGEDRFAQELSEASTPGKPVGEALSRAVLERLDNWIVLQESAGVVTPHADAISARVARELNAKHAEVLAALRAEYESKLDQAQASGTADQARRLRDRLMHLAGYGKRP